MVISGRWVPPDHGWFASITSPSFQSSPRVFTWYLTASCIEPKCTGKWGALAIKLPSGPKIAHEKSSLSFIFVLIEVFCRVIPICSAIDINLWPNIDNSIGSNGTSSIFL